MFSLDLDFRANGTFVQEFIANPLLIDNKYGSFYFLKYFWVNFGNA